MNHWIVRLVTLGMPVFLLLAACQPKDQAGVPVIGSEVAIPAQVERAHINVLEYVISSHRLANIPPHTDWQFDNREQLEGEYHFLSGDWLMIVWVADINQENQQVIISNQTEKAFWCGYVAPDGHVVDTAYMP